MDCFNNNSDEVKSESSQEPREGRRRDYRPYEVEVEPHVKLSDKVVIPIKKYPKVLSWKTISLILNGNSRGSRFSNLIIDCHFSSTLLEDFLAQKVLHSKDYKI